MMDLVPVDLEGFDARDGWLLESRIDRQGGIEIGSLLVQHLLSRIQSRACSCGFLHSAEIMQEISS